MREKNTKRPETYSTCNRGDLAFLKERLTTSPATNAEIMKSFYKRFLSIRHVPFPTIASINGHAVGAAACVAMACDIRMMADRAKFGLNVSTYLCCSYCQTRVDKREIDREAREDETRYIQHTHTYQYTLLPTHIQNFVVCANRLDSRNGRKPHSG